MTSLILKVCILVLLAVVTLSALVGRQQSDAAWTEFASRHHCFQVAQGAKDTAVWRCNDGMTYFR